MSLNRILIFFILLFIVLGFRSEQDVYLVQKGHIYFKSEAPLEIIEAKSEGLKGAIDIKNRTFVFSIEVHSFDGFQNPLQKVHFNENYMESQKHTQAFFSGKLIEKTDLTKDGTYTLRAKGKLKIHGVEQERIIKSRVIIKDSLIHLNSFFTVFLHEHNIVIPKIVQQKIAQEIQVSVRAVLSKQ